jgi:AcrR family transcriptional regulator
VAGIKKQKAVPEITSQMSTDTGLTRGHKKKARTRQTLVDAALRIFAQHGVAELQLNKLAEEAQVSNGTVYNYFRTREEVLEAVGVELANQFSHRISAMSVGVDNGAERVSIGIRMFIRETVQNPLWARAVISIYQYDKNIRSAVANYLRSDLLLGEKQGFLQFESIEIAMGIVAFSTIGSMISILDGYQAAAVDTTVAQMLLMALGLTPAKAKKIAHMPLPEGEKETEVAKKVPRQPGRPRKTSV